MTKTQRLIITTAVALGAGIFLAKAASRGVGQGGACCANTVAAAALASAPSSAAGTDTTAPPAAEAPQKLPRLVDLGAKKCIPCKMMAPILDELKKEYAGRMEVEFIDVWENPDAGKKYGIQMIPTQIFYGADGKELFRHSGFFGKEDILAKWKELGVVLSGTAK
jgi:thioredoxin 1